MRQIESARIKMMRIPDNTITYRYKTIKDNICNQKVLFLQ